MATTRYDDFINRPSATDLINRPLRDGEFIAYGSSPKAPSVPSTPIIQNLDGQSNLPQTPYYPDIQRSSMPAINLPNVVRPTENPAINPAGLPLTESQAMLRGQALRGEGMSVANRKELQAQIARERGRIGAQRQAEMDARTAKAATDSALAKVGRLEVNGETARERENRLKIEAQGGLANAKQAWQTAENDKKIAATSGNLDKKLQADATAQQAMLTYRAQEAKAQGKNIFTPEWAAQRRAELIQQGAKDTVAINRDIFKVQESMLEAAAKDGSLTFTEARTLANQLESNLKQTPTSATAIVPGLSQQNAGDVNGDGKVDVTDQALIVARTITKQQANELFTSGKWTKEQLAKYERAVAAASAWSANNKAAVQPKQ